MPQANVYTSVSAQAWFTDKCKIATGNTAVTFNIDLVYPSATGNLYGNSVSVPANNTQTVFVGVGNKITISGSNFTAQEIGTTSSGKYAVRQV
jgi:hypothetical protein